MDRQVTGASRVESPDAAGGRLAAETPAALPADRRAIVICDQWLGSNGYAGLKALRRAGWAVQEAPEWEFVPVRWRSTLMRSVARTVRPLAVREFNRELLRLAERTAPELLLVFKGTFVRADALVALRRMGVRTYCFFPDVSFRTHGPYLPRALVQYDWVFTTKSFGLADLREQLGVTRASVLPHAYDPDLHRPVELSPGDRARYGCDVSFIGTWSPKKEAVLRGVIERRPALRLRVWGDQWDRVPTSSPLRPAIQGHAVVGEEYVRAIAGSAINLGILSERRVGSSGGDQITSRTFHIPAAGGFLLHERTAEVLDLFEEGRSIACYDGLDELVARIDEYLGAADRRREVARRAREVVCAAHSWDHRIQQILAVHERVRA